MEDFFKAFCETFQAGGLLMVPLAVLAFYLYYSGVGVCIRLSKIKRVCDSDELFDAALKSFITSRELPHDAKKIFPRLRMELMGQAYFVSKSAIVGGSAHRAARNSFWNVRKHRFRGRKSAGSGGRHIGGAHNDAGWACGGYSFVDYCDMRVGAGI